MFNFIKEIFYKNNQKKPDKFQLTNLESAYKWAYSINSSKEIKTIINKCIKYVNQGFSSSQAINKTIEPLKLDQQHSHDLNDFLSTFFLYAHGLMPQFKVTAKNDKNIQHQPLLNKMLQKDTTTLFPSKSKEWQTSTLAKYKKDGAIGAKLILSTIHNDIDVCSLYANADFWGWGKGIYPLNKVPDLPHTSCRCCFEQVFDFDVIDSLQTNPQFNPYGANDYLKSLPEKDQKSILGINAWNKFINGDNYITELWITYGVLRNKYINKEYSNELTILFNTVSMKLKKVSIGARYHFVDIVEYSTYNDNPREATEMTLYETRQKEINFNITTKELLDIGLIKAVKDPLIILSKFTKDELIAIASDKNNLPKKSWNKAVISKFILENYQLKTKKIVDNSNICVLPDELKKCNQELLEFLKQKK